MVDNEVECPVRPDFDRQGMVSGKSRRGVEDKRKPRAQGAPGVAESERKSSTKRKDESADGPDDRKKPETSKDYVPVMQRGDWVIRSEIVCEKTDGRNAKEKPYEEHQERVQEQGEPRAAEEIKQVNQEKKPKGD